ncbi:MAG: NAD(P)-dependent oxidoreductase [Eubacterium sp.]|jgi:glutamate synthase (NADPH/NADH) small chain
MAELIISEAKRCLNCKNPLCRKGCPINTNIPKMIQLLLDNRMMDAAQMLIANNPLSLVCSLVCDHEKQCEGHCVRGIKGDAVHISAIEHYISDTCFERLLQDRAPDNGMKVAVIGAGPAGITIAIYLALLGYTVTIFDEKDKLGGILRYGIPEFRLPNSILDRYYEKLKELGIYFRPNFAMGTYLSIQDLLDDGYKSVFVGTGAWRPRRLRIPGESFGNVQYAINYLNNPDSYDLGNNVAVIGAGNAAMDVARTAIRHGSRNVTVYVRRDKVRASQSELDYALLDGVKFEYQKAPLRIEDQGPVICDTEITADGQVHLLEDTARLIPTDTIIISASQEPQDRLVNRDHKLKLNRDGNLKVNHLGETTMPGVFASGDVVTGANTVVHAAYYSKMIAVDMDRYMRGLPPRTEEEIEAARRAQAEADAKWREDHLAEWKARKAADQAAGQNGAN